MKKIVLFMGLIMISSFLFGQSDQEISEVIIKRGNLDSLFHVKNSQISEIEKDGWLFLQDTDEFRREELQPLSARVVSEADVVNIDMVNKSKEKNVLSWQEWVSLIIVCLFLGVPLYVVNRSTMEPRKRRFSR
jgi:hypothetical protein